MIGLISTNFSFGIPLYEGSKLTLTMEVSSDNPSHNSFLYQWNNNGVDLAGYTSNSIELTGVTPLVTDGTGGGLYFVSISSVDVGGNLLEAEPNFYGGQEVTYIPIPMPTTPPVATYNGRTWDEHRRMYLLGYI